MKARMFRWFVIGLIASIPAQGSGPEAPGIAATSPDQDLSAHITRLTRYGERADFSHDGQRVLFVDKTFGAGVGYGIFLFDLRQAGHGKEGK